LCDVNPDPGPASPRGRHGAADHPIIAAEHPRVNFILAQPGRFASQNWPEHLAVIDAANRYPNVYPERAARELPAGKLISGSDCPLVDWSR
jgi:hypothetical protein